MEYTEDQMTAMYPSDVRPVNVGPYRTYADSIRTYQYWNGNFWGYCAFSVEGAVNGKDMESFQQSVPWRGLLARPVTNDKE